MSGYWYGPVAALRPYLVLRCVPALLAFDLLRTRLGTGAEYGADGFNVAHFAWLDAVQPLPTPGLYVGVLVLASLLALVVAFAGANRLVVGALCAVYTYGWAMSLLDTYQHHYLLSLVLLCLVCFPDVRPAALPPRAPPGRRTSAWGYALLGVSVAVVYGFTAVAKLDAEWLGGHTLRSIGRPGPLLRALEAIGVAPDRAWQALAVGTVPVELSIAGGYLVAVRQDDGERPWLRLACLAAWVLALVLHGSFEAMELHIGWFSAFMILLATVFFLSERWLGFVGMIVLWPVAALDRVLGRGAPGGDLLAGVAAAALLLLVGYELDLPGAVAACGVAAGAVLGAVLVAARRGASARLRRQVRAAGLAAVVTWAAVATSASRFELYGALGDHLKARGRLPEALAAYEKAERHLAGEPAARYALLNNLGVLLHAAGRPDDAIARFRRAIEVEPDAAAAHQNLRAVLATRAP